jgi:hypothetical protein
LSSPKPNPDTPAHEPAESSANSPLNTSFERLEAENPISSSNESNPEIIEAQKDRLIQELREHLEGLEVGSDAIVTSNKELRQFVSNQLLEAMSETAEDETRKQRAQSLFVDHGYLDEVLHELRSADSAEARATAARTIGLVGSQRGTASLIAALFDESPEVCAAAADSLAKIGDPAVSAGPLNAIIEGPTQRSETELTELLESEKLSGVQESAVQTSDIAASLEAVETVIDSTGVVGIDDNEEIDVSEDPASLTEEERLFQEHRSLIKQIEALEKQLRAAMALRLEAEKDARVKAEQESRFRAQIAARRHEEEEARKRAEEKVSRRRYEDERKLAIDQLARLHAEEEAQHRVQEEERLRLQTQSLKQSATDILNRLDAEVERRKALEVAQRAEMERALLEATALHNAEILRLNNEEELLSRAVENTRVRLAEVETASRKAQSEAQRLAEERARLEAAEAASRAEAEAIREAEARRRAEQEQLVQRADELRRLGEDIAARRRALEASLEKAEEEDRHLLELEARTQAAEESRRQIQAERMRLESEIRERMAREEHLLAELRSRAHEDEQRLAEAAQQRVAEQERRLADLEALRERLEAEAQHRAEHELQMLSDIETLRDSENEMRKRIEEAEAARQSLEINHKRTSELVLQAESEARMRALEDEGTMARLEEVRRTLGEEAQARAEQEERIKKEIELLRSREAEQKNRVEQEVRRRAEAEFRLQQEKSRLKIEEEARMKAELTVELLEPQEKKEDDVIEWHEEPAQDFRRVEPPATQRLTMAFRAEATRAVAHTLDPESAADLPEAVVGKLTSNDPEDRAVAVTSLPSLGGQHTFSLLVSFFDDPSQAVRNAAARALREVDPARPVEPFTRALEAASPERRHNIGSAIATSGLAEEAINQLDAESREETYNALCLLFVMAKAGEVLPLVQAIEGHPDVEVRRAAIKLLNLSGQSELADAAAKRRLGHHVDS